jgi:hypothetical protein
MHPSPNRLLLRASAVLLVLLAAGGIHAADPDCWLSQPAGLLGMAPSVRGDPVALHVEDGLAHVVDWGAYRTGALQVFDVSDPCALVRLPDPVVFSSDEGSDIVVRGDRALVANDFSGLALYDLTDPTHPLFLARRADGSSSHAVAWDGGRYAYEGRLYASPRWLAIHDLSTFPASVPTYYTTSRENVWDLVLSGDRLFVLSWDGVATRIEVVDVTVPTAPLFAGALDLPLATYGVGAGQIRLQGDLLYIAMMSSGSSPGGLRVVDVSDVTAMSVVGKYDLFNTGAMDYQGVSLAVEGSRAYFSDRQGLHVLDVADPSAPSQVRLFGLPASWQPCMGSRLQIDGPIAWVCVYGFYVQGGHGGLAAYKLWQPVDIDIKPGSDPNSLNRGAKGVLPVAVLGREWLDVHDIDAATLRLAGAAPAERGKKGKIASCEDVNGDGFVDLVLHFPVADLEVADDATSLLLTGSLVNGDELRGSDSIRVVR